MSSCPTSQWSHPPHLVPLCLLFSALRLNHLHFSFMPVVLHMPFHLLGMCSPFFSCHPLSHEFLLLKSHSDEVVTSPPPRVGWAPCIVTDCHHTLYISTVESINILISSFHFFSSCLSNICRLASTLRWVLL